MKNINLNFPPPHKKKKLMVLIQYKERAHLCNEYWVTNYIVQTPWKASSSSASQEIPHILWNPSVHYHLHNSSPPVPFLSCTNPVHAIPKNVCEIHFNITLTSTPRSSKWSPFCGYPRQKRVRTSPPPIHATYPAHLI